MPSSFKENFERQGGDDLGYDDSAFYYYFLAVLLFTLVPTTWIMILKPMLYGEISIIDKVSKNCECSLCKERMKKRARFYQYSWINQWFLIRFVLIFFGWSLCYICFDKVKDIEPLKNFIPHEILGIEADATPTQAKRAYRKLSRKMHPDKNPDNPEAVNEFI